MGMKLTAAGVGKGIMYTAIGLVVLGLIKSSVPDIWGKVPGLNQF